MIESIREEKDDESFEIYYLHHRVVRHIEKNITKVRVVFDIFVSLPEKPTLCSGPFLFP